MLARGRAMWDKRGMGGCRLHGLVATMALWLPAVAQGEAARLDAAVAQAEALGARTGVCAARLDGKAVYQRRARERFVTASNMKLLTAVAALQGLGSDYQFVTTCALQDGNLVVKASGDPNWITGDEHGPALFYRGLVAAMQRHGVQAVREVVLDEGSFQGPSRPPTWPKDQLDAYYCAPTGGFVLDQGAFLLELKPAADGVAATLLAPLCSVPMDAGIRLSDQKNGAVYGAMDLGDRLRLQGRMWRRSQSVRIQTAMREPLPWFRRALLQALHHGGIAVDPAAPAHTEPLLYEHATPLQPALRRMLLDSSNFDAEQLTRVLGAKALADGSLQGGVEAVRRTLSARLGKLDGRLAQADGSGLSRGNEATPELFVQALGEIAVSGDAALFFDSLPVAGESGTLRGRFAGSAVAGRVRAKTGWIRGASTLSGLLERADGTRIVFSILMNYDPKKDGLNKELKSLQERIVEALDVGGGRRG